MTVRPFETILAEATRRYPDRAGVALIEGLAPLARIALTARVARRVLRLLPLQVDTARRTVENAVRAAEKAASGDSLTEEEDLAACDETVRQACELEAAGSGQETFAVGQVARMAARCVYGPEIAFGENAFLAGFDLHRAVEAFGRFRGLDIGHAIGGELAALEADLRALVGFAEQSQEPWLDLDLDRIAPGQSDRGWAGMLKAHRIAFSQKRDNGLRWQKIHEAIRHAGGCFYPPELFGPIGTPARASSP
jgi:hypothetical protein